MTTSILLFFLYNNTGSQKKNEFLTKVSVSYVFCVADHEYDDQNSLSH